MMGRQITSHQILKNFQRRIEVGDQNVSACPDQTKLGELLG